MFETLPGLYSQGVQPSRSEQRSQVERLKPFAQTLTPNLRQSERDKTDVGVRAVNPINSRILVIVTEQAV